MAELGRVPGFAPALTLGLVSAASMAVEIVAGRALAPYVGMSLYSWTMIIAVVLTGLSIGHWIGGVAADRTRRAPELIGMLLAGAAVTTVLSLSILRLTEPLLVGQGPIERVSILSLLAFLPPSLFAGVLSPLLTKLALDAAPPERQGRVLGLMFALGAGGAILGTLLAGLVMISWLGTTLSMWVIAAAYALLIAPFAPAIARERGVAIAAAVAVGAAVGMSGIGGGDPCDRESPYYCIQIDDVGFMGRETRVMALDHLAHGVNDAADPALLLTPYVHGVDEIVRRRFPGPDIDAFFIGGGAFTLPRAWLARYPNGRLLASEIDPEVTESAHARMWLPRSPQLEIRHEDARQVLATEPPERRFDVIFGDAFHDISVPAHLVTDEFHQLVAARLKPGGIYAINAVDALRRPRFAVSLARTLTARFAFVELWLHRADLGPTEARTTWIVIASDRPTGTDALRSIDGVDREWVRVPLDRMVAALEPGDLAHLTDDYAPVDRLLSTVLLDPEMAEN